MLMIRERYFTEAITTVLVCGSFAFFSFEE